MNMFNYTDKVTDSEIEYYIRLLPEDHWNLECDLIIYDNEEQALQNVKNNEIFSSFDNDDMNFFKICATTKSRKGYTLIKEDFSRMKVVIFLYHTAGNGNFACVLYHELRHVYQAQYMLEMYRDNIKNYKNIDKCKREEYEGQQVETDANVFAKMYFGDNIKKITDKYGDREW
ncbi:MAG TPA: hypothetical protein DCP90_05720 [Clostridiales bacterium]|nr:MAG: hypothetical protein A2Y22_04955 [Clostridiales bacterium GWD2_32_59]HAN10099.1 hypothetical protein [Clostridiales bacterium]